MANSTTMRAAQARGVGVSHCRRRKPDLGSIDDDDQYVRDVEETLADSFRLEGAGHPGEGRESPRRRDVEAARQIRERIKIPLIADIHYDYRMAVACLDAVRRRVGRPWTKSDQSGNIGGEERFKEIVRKAGTKESR